MGAASWAALGGQAAERHARGCYSQQEGQRAYQRERNAKPAVGLWARVGWPLQHIPAGAGAAGGSRRQRGTTCCDMLSACAARMASDDAHTMDAELDTPAPAAHGAGAAGGRDASGQRARACEPSVQLALRPQPASPPW